jgi:hypothetical protein
MERRRLIAGSGFFVIAAAAGLTGCGPASSSASASPPAAAKAPAPVKPKAACKALAAWERGSSSANLGSDTTLQKAFAAVTDLQLSGDYAVWISDIKTGSSTSNAAGDQVTADCAAYGVAIFPSAGTSPAPPASTAPVQATPVPVTSAPASTASAGTVSELEALTAAQNYLSDGEGFSRQGLIDQLDSPDGNSFSVADATWAVDHSDANWDDQAVDCAKGYMSDGEGFSRDGLIQQMTSAYGNKFTEAQAEYAANAVGL